MVHGEIEMWQYLEEGWSCSVVGIFIFAVIIWLVFAGAGSRC